MQVSRIFFIKLRRYTTIWKQLLFANDTSRARRAVLGLSQDWACTDSFENFRKNSIKGDLSNNITLNPPHFSLVNTFNILCFHHSVSSKSTAQKTKRYEVFVNFLNNEYNFYVTSFCISCCYNIFWALQFLVS